jgi:hypothetical protein
MAAAPRAVEAEATQEMCFWCFEVLEAAATRRRERWAPTFPDAQWCVLVSISAHIVNVVSIDISVFSVVLVVILIVVIIIVIVAMIIISMIININNNNNIIIVIVIVCIIDGSIDATEETLIFVRTQCAQSALCDVESGGKRSPARMHRHHAPCAAAPRPGRLHYQEVSGY